MFDPPKNRRTCIHDRADADAALVRSLLGENLSERSFSFATVAEACPANASCLSPTIPPTSASPPPSPARSTPPSPSSTSPTPPSANCAGSTRRRDSSRTASSPHLNASPGIKCEVPPNRVGDHQRSGYRTSASSIWNPTSSSTSTPNSSNKAPPKAPSAPSISNRKTKPSRSPTMPSTCWSASSTTARTSLDLHRMAAGRPLQAPRPAQGRVPSLQRRALSISDLHRWRFLTFLSWKHSGINIHSGVSIHSNVPAAKLP